MESLNKPHYISHVSDPMLPSKENGGHNKNTVPLPTWRRSGHVLPPLRAGLNIILYLNLDPVASGALQLVQSVTIHGSGTEIN